MLIPAGRTALCLFLLLFVCLLAPLQAVAQTQSESPLTVAYCNDCTPFQFTNDKGEPDGIILDYWKLWSQKTGAPIEYMPAGWNETISMVRDGKADLHAGLGFSDERDAFLEYGDRLSNTAVTLFLNKNIAIPQNILDVKAYRIGVLAGDKAESYLKDTLTSASIVAYPSYEKIMKALKRGDLMIFAADTPTGLYHLTQSGLYGDFHFDASQPLYQSPWYLASAEGRSELVKRVNKGMEQISRDERKGIVRRWAAMEETVDPNAVIIPYMANYPPLMMRGLDGQPSGFLIDVWKLWGETTKTPIVFKQVTWPETLSSIRREEADVHPGLFKSEERTTWLAFTKPLLEIKTALYFRISKDKPVPLSQMKGRKVGVVAGSYQEQFVRTKFPEVKAVGYPHNEAMVMALLKGEVDALVNEVPSVEADLSRFSLQGAVRRFGDSLFGNKVYGGVLKHNEELLAKVNKGLEAIPEEKLAELERRWFPNSSDRFNKSSGFDDSLELTEAEKEWIRNNPVIKVGVTSFIDPVDRLDKNGLYTGLNADLIEKLNSYLRINLAPVFHDSWGDVVKNALSGKTDCVLSFSKTPEREKSVLFTEPYALDPVIVVVRDVEDSIKDWKDLKGKRVSAVTGASMLEELHGLVGDGKVVVVESEAKGLELLASGKVDAHSSWLIPYGNAQRANEVPGLKVALRRASETGTLRIGVHKSQPELYSILSKGLRRIPATELEAMRKRWLAPPSEKAVAVKLTVEEREWLKNNPTIRVGGTPDWPPFEYDEGNGYTGISADLLRLAAKRAGLRVEYDIDTFAGIVTKLKNKELSLNPAMAQTPERDEFLAFTKPYIQSDDVILVKNSRSDIRSLNDLKGKMVAVEKDYFTEEFLRTQYPEIKRIIVPSTLSALKQVVSGQADAYIGVQAVAAYLMGKHLITNLKVAGYVENKSTILRVGVRKDQPLLRGILDKAYATISPEERNQIINRYISMESQAPKQRVELTQEESAWLANLSKPLIIGAETDWPPFDFVEDGKPTGFANELLRLAADKAGLPVEFVHGLTWTEILTQFREEKIDLLPCVFKSPDRLKEMALTKDYVANPTVLVVNESFKGTASLERFPGRTIAVVNGFAINKTLHDKYPAIKQFPVDSVLEGLKAVSLGKADGFIGSFGVITYLLKKNLIPGIRIADEVWLAHPDETKLHMAVLHKNAIIRDILQKGLDAVTEAEKDALRAEWLGMAALQGRRAKVKLTEKEKAWVHKAKPIRMSVDPNWLPIERINRETGEYEGIAADYVNLISEVTGLKFELVPTARWADSVKRAKEGKTDMLVAASKTKEREAFMDFSLPYITLSNAVVMRNDAPYVNDIRDLVGLRVGVGDGNSIHRYLAKNHPDLTLVPNKGTLNGLQMVANGEVDAYVGTLEVMGYLINNNGMFNLKVALKLPMARNLHIAVRKEVDPEVLSIINKALESITPEENSDIFRKWISLRVEEKFDYTLLYKIGLPVGCVILLIIGIITFWNRKLSHEIDERKVIEARLKDAFGVITSSIRYASRIQRSVLPTEEVMQSMLKEHFVLWEPRDVVGGDIYWARKWGKGSVILLADCTGHGVPGAFMTLISSGALDRALIDVKEGDSGALIQRMHQLVQEVLSQQMCTTADDDHCSDDGLELGVCYIPEGKDSITFAGAGFPLFVHGTEGVQRIRGNRKGIGYRNIAPDTTWKNVMVPVERDMTFYMSSDGIYDQIGGPKKRGYGKKRFMRMLESVQSQPVREQGGLIRRSLEEYQEDEKRRDDVAAIGFRL